MDNRQTGGSQGLAHWDRLETICNEFEASWLHSRRPAIKALVTRAENACESEILLQSLVEIDVEFRLRLGQNVQLADYIPLVTDNSRLVEAAFEDAGHSVSGSQTDEESVAQRSGQEATSIPDSRALGGDQLFGRFKILELIESGGMGDVFRAIDTQINRVVALKKIKLSVRGSGQELFRFRNEAQAAARLEHPGIIEVFEFDFVGGQPFLAMKYIPGKRSLSDYILETHQDPPSEFSRNSRLKDSVEIMAKIAEAVGYGHSRGVIHRDLKPSNILMDEMSNPIVTDFGLARLVDATMVVTNPGDVLGTPRYMSPEQTIGRADEVTARSDVYTLGVLFYELLTGRVPHTGDNQLELFRSIQLEPPLPFEAAQGIPNDLKSICLACLAKEENMRQYNSGSELAADLRNWLEHRSVLAHKPSLWEKLAGTIARTRLGHEFRDWTFVCYGLATIVFVGNWLTAWARYRGWPIIEHALSLIVAILLMGVVIYSLRVSLRRLLTMVERQLVYFIGTNFLALFVFDILVINLSGVDLLTWSAWTKSPPDFDVATLVPFWCTINGLILFVMGTGYGGRFFVAGIAFFGIAIGLSGRPELSLGVYGTVWGILLVYLGRHFRAQ